MQINNGIRSPVTSGLRDASVDTSVTAIPMLA